jgi:Flp pilus assembly protein TadG
MRAELQLFRKSLRRVDRGNALVIFTLFIAVLFGFAALSLDVANVLREQRKLQIGTDAAALNGVANLTGDMVNLSAQKDSAIAEATIMANTNGVTNAEIAAGARKGFPGEIQVGRWSDGTFVADATPYSAVRVPARRNVPLNFGRVVGLGEMNPAVDSVAEIGAFSIPYGVPAGQLVPNGDTMYLQSWPRAQTEGGGVGGNWGPLDFCGDMNGTKNVVALINGGGCFATVNDVTSVGTGFEGLKQAFKQYYENPDNPNHYAVVPITENYPKGNHEITILGFAIIEILDSDGGSGSGAGWTLQVRVLGTGFGALRQYGFGLARVLVE